MCDTRPIDFLKVMASEPLVPVTVRTLSGGMLGTFEVAHDELVSSLKRRISDAGGPAPSEQKIVAGHRVLVDTDEIAKALDGGGMVFLVTVRSCPTCDGPCCCKLCGCEPQYGLIDFYGRCKQCTRVGGHASRCPFCRQEYPSLCALDTHVKFSHDEKERASWTQERLVDHLERLKKDPLFRAPRHEEGTFLEACRGGLVATRA